MSISTPKLQQLLEAQAACPKFKLLVELQLNAFVSKGAEQAKGMDEKVPSVDRMLAEVVSG